MVLDTAKLKNKKSTIWPGVRGRDAAGKLTLKVNILQVFTIDFSEIQFIVNHNSHSDGQNKSAKSGTNLQKKTIHIVSLHRERGGIMVSHFEQNWQKWAYETSIRFSRWLSMKNRIHHESDEQIEEPISPVQYRRWHPSSSTSWWDKSEWNWK